jgi:hypothetical protein
MHLKVRSASRQSSRFGVDIERTMKTASLIDKLGEGHDECIQKRLNSISFQKRLDTNARLFSSFSFPVVLKTVRADV